MMIGEGYPEHPTSILFRNKYYPKGLVQRAVWDHYDKYRKKIIKEINYRPVTLFIKTEYEYIVRRKINNTAIILSSSNFNQIITGRTVALAVETGSNSDYIVVDIDPGKNVKDKDMRKCIEYLLNNSISKLQMVRSYRIILSGRGFHVYFNLEKSANINSLRKMIYKLFILEVNNKYLINVKRPGPSDINLDLSPMYDRGCHQVAGALCRNGLMAADVTKTWKSIDRRNFVVK